MTLDKIFEHGKEAAQHLFKEQGMIHPMWICEQANGEIFPICIQMPDRGERDAFAKALKLTFKRNNVVRYVALLESWILELPFTTDVENLDLSESLEHHQDRREVVFIQAEDKDGSQRAGQFYILRPEHDKPTLSEFKEMSDDKPSEGRFVRLLNTEN